MEEINVIQWHNFCVHKPNSAGYKLAKFRHNPHIVLENYATLNFVQFCNHHPLIYGTAGSAPALLAYVSAFIKTL